MCASPFYCFKIAFISNCCRSTAFQIKLYPFFCCFYFLSPPATKSFLVYFVSHLMTNVALFFFLPLIPFFCFWFHFLFCLMLLLQCSIVLVNQPHFLFTRAREDQKGWIGTNRLYPEIYSAHLSKNFLARAREMGVPKLPPPDSF